MSRGSRFDLPRVLFGAGRVLYTGPALDLAPHRNIAATVALALGSVPFRVAFGSEAPRTVRAAYIPPSTQHHLQAGGPMAFAYLDGLGDAAPESATLEALAGGDAEPHALLAAVCRSAGHRTRPAVSPRLVATIRALDRSPNDFLRVEAAAEAAGLSVSRFQHVFRDATGVPFRRYRLWRRLRVVARALAEGGTLTRTAHEAGFSNSAHLSASFRDMFGLAPSALLRRGLQITLEEDTAVG